jgi:hypothetical protein
MTKEISLRMRRGCNYSAYKGYFAFLVGLDSTPSPNIHTFLPSGVAIIGIDLWVERFIKIFQNIKPEHEALSSVPINFRTQSSPPNAISFQKTGGDL